MSTRHVSRFAAACTAAFTLASLTVATAKAGNITADEFLYQSGDNPAFLNASIDMSLSGNVLQILLTNTTTADVGDSAGNLLTGLGFNLPTGVTVDATANGGNGNGAFVPNTSTAHNFTLPANRDISSEWGYTSGQPSHGHFHVGDAIGTDLVNTVVSSHQVDADTRLATGSLGNPPHMGGPDFGILSGSVAATVGGGQELVRDTLRITLVLTGLGSLTESQLLASIEAGHVAVAWGSPTASTLPPPSVLATAPEPASATLLAFGAVSALVFRRRKTRLV